MSSLDTAQAATSPRPAWSRWIRRKDWDDHVADLEAMASTEGFRDLRDRLVALAQLQPGDRVLDVGSGTGLLALCAARAADDVAAVDISSAMTRRLAAKTRALQLPNVRPITAPAHRIPLPDAWADVVVSNYCYHHLKDGDKLRALSEARRVLRPGGRLVIGDMMFRVRVSDARDRAIIGRLVVKMLRRGPAGLVRLARNALRYVTGRWEYPADAAWWADALRETGFDHVEVQSLEHEGGIACARRPVREQTFIRRRSVRQAVAQPTAKLAP